MKKLCFIVVGISLLTAFYACQKEQLGVYNPKMRIEKIYNETDSHYLLEQWVWNESTLSKIDRFRSSGNILYTDNYVYDEQNRLARIERDNQYTEFLYEGKLLTTINTYSNKKLVETYHLTYEKDKLAHISIEKPAKGAGNVDLFSLFLPGNADVMESVFPTKDSKIETYNYSSVKMDFQWDGDNVRYLEMEIVRPDSTQHLTFTYIYDNSINPKNGFLSLQLDRSLINDQPQYVFCSKNNVRNVLVSEMYDIYAHTESFTYSYDCYKDYPTKVYATSPNWETGMDDSTLIYTYVYVY